MNSVISKPRMWPIWKELKHFAVSAACEDFSSTARTDEFCRGLSADLGRNCQVERQTWFFSQLGVRELRAIAAGEAALAHLIIISVHYFDTLPDGVKDWIELWLRQRNNHRTVLLTLLDPVYQGFSSSLEGYLQDVANRGGMEFLVTAEDWRDCR